MSSSQAASTKKHARLTAPILVNSAEVEVMRALRRQGRISGNAISSITGGSKAKASQEIRSPVEKGYLLEVGEGASQGGRKPRLLRNNNQLGCCAGIDIGATSFSAVVNRSLPLPTTHLSIKFSRMGPNTGVMGAISLALDYLVTIEDNPHFMF